MKLVRFEDGKYGVLEKRFFFFDVFLDLDDYTWWSEPRHVIVYCKGSKERAQKALRCCSKVKYEVVND